MPTVLPCPSCGQRQRVADNLLGRKVKCVRCQTVFRAEPEPAEPLDVIPADEERVTPGAPRRRRPTEFAPEDEPQDWDDRPGSYEQAAEALRGPAIGLLVAGGIGILAGIAGVLLLVAKLFLAPQANPEPAVYSLPYWAGAVLPTFWSVIVLAAGYYLLRVEQYGSAKLGCVIALLPCNVAWPVGLPIGIWALRVLGKPSVKRAFVRRVYRPSE
ncbi:MAG TPA: hypothetical protein VG013_04185 [Gemmataceae bacterium]|jgi:predicted Zn finger-like uncharacterized protein|nr:hypothetical protein [Gemmataceae bacterium]